MEKFTDRIIIFLFMVFAMGKLFTGKYLIVVIYLTLSITFFCYALLRKMDQKDLTDKKFQKWIVCSLQFFWIAFSFFSPKLFVLLPVIFYDLVAVKNYLGMILGVCSFLFAVWSKVGLELLFYVGFLSAFSCWLSVRSERLVRMRLEYKRLRDEFVVKEEELREKHLSLLFAKDQEIYTAQLQERNRIAREIHDHVGHMLTRAILQLGALFTIYKEEPLHTQLSKVKDTLDLAMKSIRTSVHDLHDESVDIEDAVRQIVEPLKERYFLRLEMDMGKNVPAEIRYVMMGVVKEAVSNILKYSTNDAVDIHLQEHPAMYQFVVHDYLREGKNRGISVFEFSDHRGMGLMNMKSRVESVGGNIRISKGEDFRIFITIPKRIKGALRK
ncbi:MAG: hypothetical protein IJ733_14055 [Lachnospiraceae bacterium]|nr:hypothetical protein [Lachnospiraceae bacterium]